MSHSLPLVIAAVLVAAPFVTTTPSAAQNASFSVEERAAGEATVKAAAIYFASTARDRSSLAFRHVCLGKRPRPTSNSKVVVCGEVNGRNGFGGQTGFEPFIAPGKDVFVGMVAGMSVQEACLSDRVFDARDYAFELKAALEAR